MVGIDVYIGRPSIPSAVPPEMPIITRGLPSTSSALNDGLYHTTAQASEFAVNINGVSSASKSAVVVYIINNATRAAVVGTGPSYYGVPQNFTVDIHTSSSGTKPTSGWTTLATVTNNFASELTVPTSGTIDMSTAGWMRVNVTTSRGGTSDIQLDGHDCRNGRDDTHLFIGDSNTMQAYNGNALDGANVELGGDGPLETQIELATGRSAPIIVNAGIGGETMDSFADDWTPTLKTYPAKYVWIAPLGSNDAANIGGVASGGQITTFVNALKSNLDQYLANDKTVFVATIPWGNANGSHAANVVTFNAKIVEVLALSEYEDVKLGPDLYALSNGQHSLIYSDGRHFTWLTGQGVTSSHPLGVPNGLTGYEAVIWLTAQFMVEEIYTP